MQALLALAVLGRLLLFTVIGKALLVAINAAGCHPELWLHAALPALGAAGAGWLIAALAGVCFFALELKARSPARGALGDAPEADSSQMPLDLQVAWPQDHAQPLKGFPPDR